MPTKKLFYGWVVVAAAFLVMFVGFGVAYSFSAFFLSLQSEFAASRGDVSLVFSVSGCLYFVLGAVSGPLADRLGPRWVITGGMLLIGIGLLAAARADLLWQIYVTYGLAVGVGVGFSYVPSIGAVQRWFVRRRGFASGIAVAGIGAGTLVMPPAAAWVIDMIGWRDSYVALAVFAIVVGGGAALLIERDPGLRGLRPDGDRSAPAAAAGGDRSLTLGEALRTAPFWWMFVAATITSFGIFIPFVHLAPFAVDHGYSVQTGVILVGMIGIGSLAGRFFLGVLADRWGRRRSFAAMFVGLTVMLFWWWLNANVWALGLFAFMFGVFYGGFVALAPALASDYFGGAHISGIIGFLYSGVGIGTLFGPTVAGFAYDATGSYDGPILAAALIEILAVVCIWRLQEPAKWRAGMMPAASQA